VVFYTKALKLASFIVSTFLKIILNIKLIFVYFKVCFIWSKFYLHHLFYILFIRILLRGLFVFEFRRLKIDFCP
ncbi:hypothetical protein D9M24_08005, partial [Campylobacter jejuni]|nr:hypothetical protein [Campylobacter jejuni]